jgi:hypothetical protein
MILLFNSLLEDFDIVVETVVKMLVLVNLRYT